MGRQFLYTCRDHNYNLQPERLWPVVDDPQDRMIEKARSIVQQITVQLAHGNHHLSRKTQTAVTVSMHRTKLFCVKYRLSENAYSFHIWPMRTWIAPDKTNHMIVISSPVLSEALILFAIRYVEEKRILQAPKNTLRSAGTDHSFAAYPSIEASNW
ncbi:hypothetical protein KC351_g117 [Hortaea werneckii]|nr:hypothetical protein KC351_g117 [Hortaea werneckii]